MKKSLGAQALLLPAPVLMVGTYDRNDKPNLMAASWGGLCSSHPPCIAVSLREETYTHASILARQAFTISIATEATMLKADACGIYSGEDMDKFAQLGLTAVKAGTVDAPYAEEFPVVLECHLIGTVALGSHTQFIGQIMDVKADESVITKLFSTEFGPENYRLEIMQIKPILLDTATYNYHGVTQKLGRAFSAGRNKVMDKLRPKHQ